MTGFVRPYRGTTAKIIKALNTATVKQYNIKPGSGLVEGGELGREQIVLTWLESEVQNLVDGGNILVFWGVENDDQGSEQTQRTSNPSDVSEFFLQQERCQDRTS